MKALELSAPGSLLHLSVVHDRPVPTPAPDEALLRVMACGLNPVDYKLILAGHPHWHYPMVPGLDVAGIVEAVGQEVLHLRPGDRVYYHGNLSAQHGGLAEYATGKAAAMALLPEGVDFVTAASLPCAALTAYQALMVRTLLQPGQDVLVQAGSGGVGGFAIQLANMAGCRVIATCSGRNAAYVRSLGAEEVIDYRQEDVFGRVMGLTQQRGVDVLLESTPRRSTLDVLGMLAHQGTWICLLGLPDSSVVLPFGLSPTLMEVSLGSAYTYPGSKGPHALGGMAAAFIKLVAEGHIRPLPIQPFALADAPKALQQLQDGHVAGKLVVDMQLAGRHL